MLYVNNEITNISLEKLFPFFPYQFSMCHSKLVPPIHTSKISYVSFEVMANLLARKAIPMEVIFEFLAM